MNFGKFSSHDLHLFLDLADAFDVEFLEARDVLLQAKERLFAPDCLKPAWSHLYELPILQHATQGVELLGGVEFIQQISKSQNQIQFMQDALNAFDAEMDAWEPNFAEKEEMRKSLAAIFAFSYSLMLSFRSLKIFGLYLNDLVAIVRDGGSRSEKALLAAVKIDQTILACPTINAYVSQRVLLSDDQFLKRLRRALVGKLTPREQKNYQQMRLTLQVLKEVGANKLSAKDLYRLFVDELALVARDRNDDVGDVEENLAALVRYALATGCRAREIAGLEWNRVDLARHTAWLNQTKNGTPRGVPLNSDAMAVLEEQIGKHPQYCFTYRGKPIRWELTNTGWHKALARAGLVDLRFHDLRHTWASWHRQAGTSCDELKDLGGWKSRQMVDRYAKYSTEHLSAAASRIENGRGGNVIEMSRFCHGKTRAA